MHSIICQMGLGICTELLKIMLAFCQMEESAVHQVSIYVMWSSKISLKSVRLNFYFSLHYINHCQSYILQKIPSTLINGFQSYGQLIGCKNKRKQRTIFPLFGCISKSINPTCDWFCLIASHIKIDSKDLSKLKCYYLQTCVFLCTRIWKMIWNTLISTKLWRMQGIKFHHPFALSRLGCNCLCYDATFQALAWSEACMTCSLYKRVGNSQNYQIFAGLFEGFYYMYYIPACGVSALHTYYLCGYTPIHLKSVGSLHCMRLCLACNSYALVMHCPLAIMRVLCYGASIKDQINNCTLPPLSCKGCNFLLTWWGEQEYI